MTKPSTPNYGELAERDGQLHWWNGEKWLSVRRYDRDDLINDLCERVAQLEARLGKQDEYLQEQGEWE